MKTARQTAFEILNRINRDNSYSNLILDSYLEKNELNSTDKAFTSALVYGVIERLITLDFELSCYLKQPLKKHSRLFRTNRTVSSAMQTLTPF